MNDMVDLDTPIDTLMTVQGQMPNDDPDGAGALINHYVSRVPEVPAPREMQFQPELERLTLGYMPGSIKGKIPEPLYVFSRGRNLDRPLDIGELGYTHSLFVVSSRVKAVLETLSIKNSEFYPVSMVYSTKGINSEDWGGGPVVSGTHWLWWCFATFDLIDVEKTEALLTPMVEPNHALPDAPLVHFHHVGRESKGPLTKAVLKYVPYDESDAFTILGWPNTPLIVSPAFVEAFTDAGLVDPDGPIWIGAFALDGPRASRLHIDFHKKLVPRKPPLRILGTAILAADSHDPPFHTRRSPYFPLPRHL